MEQMSFTKIGKLCRKCARLCCQSETFFQMDEFAKYSQSVFILFVALHTAFIFISSIRDQEDDFSLMKISAIASTAVFFP